MKFLLLKVVLNCIKNYITDLMFVFSTALLLRTCKFQVKAVVLKFFRFSAAIIFNF